MFTRGKTPEPTPVPPPKAPVPEAPKKAPAVSRAGPSIVSADVKMKGTLVSMGELDINGQIEGDVRASALTIGESGAIKGEVVAESVVVKGTVEGRIRGRKVQLCTGAKVRGDIYHASLAIEPNAIFEGQVRHSQDPMTDSPDMQPQPPTGG